MSKQAHTASEVGTELAGLLADSYTTYLLTQNCHWNVTGPHFPVLHALFEEQYTELAAAVDEIAERLRALNIRAPGTYREFGALTAVEELAEDADTAAMLASLIAANEQVLARSKGLLASAETAGDQATQDVAAGRIGVHEKALWMLRATAS